MGIHRFSSCLGQLPHVLPCAVPGAPSGATRPGCPFQVHPLLSGHLLHPRQRAVHLLTTHWETPTHPGSKMSLVLQPPCAEASGSLCDLPSHHCHCMTRVLATPKKLRVWEAVGGALTPQPPQSSLCWAPVGPVVTQRQLGDWLGEGGSRLLRCGCQGFHCAASGDTCG